MDEDELSGITAEDASPTVPEDELSGITAEDASPTVPEDELSDDAFNFGIVSVFFAPHPALLQVYVLIPVEVVVAAFVITPLS